MLLLGMRPASYDTDAEEVLITTRSGEQIVVALMKASGRRNGEQIVGFIADPEVSIVRRPLEAVKPVLRRAAE